jgi:hypothetical protein
MVTRCVDAQNDDPTVWGTNAGGLLASSAGDDGKGAWSDATGRAPFVDCLWPLADGVVRLCNVYNRPEELDRSIYNDVDWGTSARDTAGADILSANKVLATLRMRLCLRNNPSS